MGSCCGSFDFSGPYLAYGMRKRECVRGKKKKKAIEKDGEIKREGERAQQVSAWDILICSYVGIKIPFIDYIFD